MKQARVLLFIILSVFGSAYTAQAEESTNLEYRKIAAQLEEIRKSVSPGKQFCETPDFPEDPNLSFGSMPEAIPQDQNDALCKELPEVAGFCSAVLDKCVGFCLAPPSVVDQRMRSSGLQHKILRRTQELFDKIKNSPDVITACCGSDQKCSQAFLATELRVSPTLDDDDGVSYSPSRKWVIVGLRAAMRWMTRQGIEQALLHELGHACQFSKHNEPNDPKYKLLSESQCVSSDISQDDIQALPGPDADKAAVCLWRSMKAAAKQWQEQHDGRRPCFGQWMKETFADAAFAFRKKALANWAFDCVSRSDESHGPRKAVIGCLLMRKEPRGTLCGK